MSNRATTPNESFSICVPFIGTPNFFQLQTYKSIKINIVTQ